MEFLRSLFRPRHHDVTVVLYGDDVEFGRRRELRNGVVAALEQARLGEYLGGGSMVSSAVPNYDMQFRVINKDRALVLVSDTLRSLGAGPDTDVRVGSGTPQKLY